MIMLFNVDDHHLARLLSHFHHFLSADCVIQFFNLEKFISNDYADDGDDGNYGDEVDADDADDDDDDEDDNVDDNEDGEDDDDTCMGQR